MVINMQNFDEKAVLTAYKRFFIECGYSAEESENLAKSLKNGDYAGTFTEMVAHFKKPITISVRNTDTINNIIRYISVL